MANYDSFVFEGHGYSEVTGGFDPGAVNGSVTENSLVDSIVKEAKKYLDSTGLSIHYDENNFTDKDLSGNTYRFKCGISVHINSCVGASGVEIIVPSKEKYLNADFNITSKISSKLNIPNRGVKSRDYNSEQFIMRTNGVPLSGTDYYGEIRDAWNRGVSLAILEVGFIQEDLAEIQANIKLLGYLVAEYIASNCDKTLPPFTNTTPNKPTTNSNVKYRVVCGSFSNREYAVNRMNELKAKGFESFIDIIK